MTALSTDLVRQSTSVFTTTLEDDLSESSDTVTLQSVTGLSLITAVTIIVDAVDANNNPTPTLREVITGVVNTGTGALETCLRGLDNTTQQSHSSGANVQMWVTGNLWNDFGTSYLTEHVQLGHHQSLSDVNGNAWIAQIATSDAVNNLEVANAATTNAPSIAAVGDDTNISLNLVPKGTGQLELAGTPLTGLTGAWQSWTPSWTNLTIGNATVNGQYLQIGNSVWYSLSVSLGSTSSMGTNPEFSLPASISVTPANPGSFPLGSGGITLAVSDAVFPAYVQYISSTTAVLFATDTASNPAQFVSITSTVPFTWTAGSCIDLTGFYQCT